MVFKTQTFTEPGTWTNPNTSVVKRVRVRVVGGGGGGGAAYTNPPSLSNQARSGGGGGGYKTATVPVGSSEPVIVGAGGAGGVVTLPSLAANADGAVGGTSSFGSGASLVTVDGGGAGTLGPAPKNAPPNGGGGGYGTGDTPFFGSGGLGYPGYYAPNNLSFDELYGGGMFTNGSQTTLEGRFRYAQSLGGPTHPLGKTYGGGGNTGFAGSGTPTNLNGTANTGGGAVGKQVFSSPTVTTPVVGGTGGSGIVIVEWYE